MAEHDDLLELAVDVARGAEGAPAAVVLMGPTGIGKSMMLRRAMAAVSGGDTRVLFAAGGNGAVAPQRYASLSEAIWPIADAGRLLPPALRAALSEVLGISTTAISPGSALLRQAIAALFEAAAQSTPLLLAIDDLDGFDQESRDTVVELLPRLFGGRVRALLTTRRCDLLPGMDWTVQMFEVPPLPEHRAAELLVAQARPPDSSVRGEIVRWAGGNPLALIESARACGRSGTTTFRTQGIAGPGGAYSQFVHRLSGLPADCRTLLVHAAAGTGSETIDAITEAAGFGTDLFRWAPATSARLLTITDDRLVRFDHPLIQTASYAESSLSERQAAHLALSRSCRSDPLRRAWHAASAATCPDEHTAGALETAAATAMPAEVGYPEIARAMQRAAQLSPGSNDGARRYGLAASAANFAEDPAWALALSNHAARIAGDADPRGCAALTRASILLQSGHPQETFHLIQTVLDDPSPPHPYLAVNLLYLAAASSYYSGEPGHQRSLNRWLAHVESDWTASDSHLPAPFPASVAELQCAYIRLYAEAPDSPHGRPAGLDDKWLHPGPARDEPYRRLVAGLSAYVAEGSAAAVRDLTKAIELLAATGGLRGFSYARAPLAWALLDTGRWTMLADLLDGTAALPAIENLGLLAAESHACRAQLLAYQGDCAGARRAVARARRALSPAGNSGVTDVALIRATGWQHACAGDFESAYQMFRQMFTANGEPVHFVVSHRGIADLAWAAARCGRTQAARPLITGIAERLGGAVPPRLGLLRHQALALVATTTRASERHFRLAVTDPAGDDWPLERARARLHYGEWLRRARRPAEARTFLAAALDTFQHLGARLLADIASSELRAAGIAATASPASDGFESLTAQQQQIALLAGTGLTNREIASRLNLSPRTIGSHLYQVYPKLGISRRHQLRDFAS